MLLAAQWGICCQELTFVDDSFCYSGPLFLTDELVFKGSMLPMASHSNVSFRIDGECHLQLEIRVVPGTALCCLWLSHSAFILVNFPWNRSSQFLLKEDL